MKKILLIATIILSLFITIPRASAAGFSTTIKGIIQINSGQQFTLTFNVIGGSNLMGLTAKLNYDSSKLTLVSSSGKNGFTATVGSNIVVDSTTGKNGNFSFLTLTFKPTSNFTVGSSTIVSISNVNGSDGNSDISGIGSSVRITMSKPKSGNNNLASLKVNGTSISNFNPSTTSYKVIVDNNITSADIKAAPADLSASIKGTGVKSLDVYSNYFKIVVTAENGYKKTYTINIMRKDEDGRLGALSNNNKLSSLVIEGYDIDFNPDKTNYDLNVDNTVAKLNITAKAGPEATIKINNVDELKAGNNVITIEVTAENEDKKTYTLNVTRRDDNPIATIETFASVAEKTTKDTIIIEIKDDKTIITSDILRFIKENNKNIIVNKYEKDKLVYSWHISGKYISSIKDYDTNIKYSSDNIKEIEKLTNYSEALYLNFAYEGYLPIGTKIKIYVGDRYADGEILKLYSYNEKISLEKDNIKVEDGYIEYDLDHCSEYFLTRAVLNKKTNNISISTIIAIIEGAAIVLLSVYFISKKWFRSL